MPGVGSCSWARAPWAAWRYRSSCPPAALEPRPVLVLKGGPDQRVFTKVASDGQARRNAVTASLVNQPRKRSVRVVHEHFEVDFNAAWPGAVVCKHPLTCRWQMPGC